MIKHGDISNRPSPRWLFVFEGLIGTLPPGKERTARLWAGLGQWRRVVRLYEIEPHVAKILWDILWRLDIRFDVVTFLGEDFAEAVQWRLEVEDLPFRHVVSYESPTALGKQLAYLVDVQRVVHADPHAVFTYGDRGQFVRDPNELVIA